jgi:hypothetical protein
VGHGRDLSRLGAAHAHARAHHARFPMLTVELDYTRKCKNWITLVKISLGYRLHEVLIYGKPMNMKFGVLIKIRNSIQFMSFE